MLMPQFLEKHWTDFVSVKPGSTTDDSKADQSIPIALSVCLSVCRVVYCGQTVQAKPMVCIEVEYEWGADISIGTIFDSLGSP